MNKQFNHLKTDSHGHHRSGLTLVELLVVVTILAIVSAILVPQLRIANQDRNMREAGRLVAATFAEASQRAVNEGIAGVLIQRNQNIFDPWPASIPAGGTDPDVVDDDVFYAGTTLFVMRRLPAYTGDDTTPGMATVVGGGIQVTIPTPFEQYGADSVTSQNEADAQDPSDDLIQVGDSISLNYSSAQYLITAVQHDFVGGITTLTLNNRGVLATLPAGSTFPFVIQRQPRKLESSRIDLPPGYLIDLRASGELSAALPTRDLPNAGDNINSPPSANRPIFYQEADASDIIFLYNGSGGIDRYTFANGTSAVPTTTQYFLIRELGTSIGDETEAAILSDPASVWVTVDPTTGNANVLNAALPTPDVVRTAASLSGEIMASRAAVANNSSANQ